MCGRFSSQWDDNMLITVTLKPWYTEDCPEDQTYEYFVIRLYLCRGFLSTKWVLRHEMNQSWFWNKKEEINLSGSAKLTLSEFSALSK